MYLYALFFTTAAAMNRSSTFAFVPPVRVPDCATGRPYHRSTSKLHLTCRRTGALATIGRREHTEKRCVHSVLQSASKADGLSRDDNFNANLFQVTPVPMYEEMLAWAEETDARIASGELPPLGSGESPTGVSPETNSALSGHEQAQIDRVSELLNKRRQQDSPLSEADAAALRTAMEGVVALVNDDTASRTLPNQAASDAILGNLSHSEDDASVVANASSVANESNQIGGDNVNSHVQNPIYGSREVRDKIYLYAWSLLKRQQEESGLLDDEGGR